MDSPTRSGCSTPIGRSHPEWLRGPATPARMMKTSQIGRAPVVADRVRSIAGQGFCFVPHRFLRDGFFASLSPEELLLYFLLVLAGDRYGVSLPYIIMAIC